MRRRIAPSILAADFGRLHDQVQSVVDAGAEVVHIDIMDGHFVPTLSMGPPAVAGLRDVDALLDIHLMIERPERHVQDFAAAGANNITVHYESTPHVHKAVQAIKEAGCTAGVALTPSTPVEAVSEIRGELWSVLCMTVNPGWGGQRFLEASPSRIERLRAMAGAGGPGPVIEVDGGIGADTVARCAAAGAGLFVAGSAVFGAPDAGAAVREIGAAAAKAGSH